MEQYVNNGLDLLRMDDISQDIANLGFNCVRLAFSIQQFVDYPPPLVSKEYLTANPELMGKTSPELFYATVDSLVDAGLMVVLNNHNSKAMWCCDRFDGEGLWHTDEYSENDWK